MSSVTISPPTPLPRTVVLVGNPRAGHRREALEHARRLMAQDGLHIVETIPMQRLEQLRNWVKQPDGTRPLIVAAGGDGTVGAVANYVANTSAVLGILPLGTSNDVARSLDIPLRLDEAVRLLRNGWVVTMDLGQFTGQGEQPRYFAHAAAMGVDVAFSRLATQPSLRKRLGRFTYIVAALLALRDRQPFHCEIEIEGRKRAYCLLHLSVINAPIFGGRLELRLSGSDPDDRRLDVLAIEDVSLPRLICAIVPLLARQKARVGGAHLYHVRRMHVHVDHPLDVSLDGEIAGHLPSEFVLAPEALRVVAGPRFIDIDD